LSASYIPGGKQYFPDINGNPLVAGTVGMYIPGTLIVKNTWQDVGQTVLNTDPIVLDSRGQAVIYGSGSYRQIVKDSLGNVIWDKLTYSIGSGGAAGGGVKTITHASSPYTLLATDGVLFCNVSAGAITINLLAATTYGAELSIKIKGTATNNVTVIPNGTDTIDGGANYILAFDNQSITIVSDLVSYWGVI
jgi:hypothetical protein